MRDPGKLEHIAIPKTFIMILDMYVSTLAFVIDNKYLGVSFKNLIRKLLFPIMNVVFRRMEISC